MRECLVDTDILSYYFKGEEAVIQNFRKYSEKFSFINLSLITYYEILSGLRFKNSNKILNNFIQFSRENNIIPLTIKSVNFSSIIYSELRKSGQAIADADILIAGIALENNLTLVTNNVRHFSKIKGLIIDNWKK